MATNSPPAAYMSYPYGTQSSPTVINTVRPTVTWGQSDPDPGAVFQYFQIQITNEANTVMVLDSGKVGQNTTSTNGSWLVNADLPAGQKLRIRVKVWDQHGAESDWSPQAWMFINRAPSGALTFVTPIYEHDTPIFTVTSTDPDGDTLNVQVESSLGGGSYVSLIQWSGVPSGETKRFSHGPLARGTYTFRLTLDDGKGGLYQQTYGFTVLPLELSGRVGHTPEWESYRQLWNTRFPEQTRSPETFWAGEAFVLAAEVTDTGTSSTKPLSVTATLLSTGEAVDLAANSGRPLYKGMLLNTEHPYTLSQGPHTFRFAVRWSNGLDQTYDVPIRIEGSIFDVIVNQIRH